MYDRYTCWGNREEVGDSGQFVWERPSPEGLYRVGYVHADVSRAFEEENEQRALPTVVDRTGVQL